MARKKPLQLSDTLAVGMMNAPVLPFTQVNRSESESTLPKRKEKGHDAILKKHLERKNQEKIKLAALAQARKRPASYVGCTSHHNNLVMPVIPRLPPPPS
eukprot:m.137979 g.137979  ORF g.137979 m.137979 type:complete len:100 (-) comp24016_c0_seq1:1631-1930(-)